MEKVHGAVCSRETTKSCSGLLRVLLVVAGAVAAVAAVAAVVVAVLVVIVNNDDIERMLISFDATLHNLLEL